MSGETLAHMEPAEAARQVGMWCTIAPNGKLGILVEVGLTDCKAITRLGNGWGLSRREHHQVTPLVTMVRCMTPDLEPYPRRRILDSRVKMLQATLDLLEAGKMKPEEVAVPLVPSQVRNYTGFDEAIFSDQVRCIKRADGQASIEVDLPKWHGNHGAVYESGSPEAMVQIAHEILAANQWLKEEEGEHEQQPATRSQGNI